MIVIQGPNASPYKPALQHVVNIDRRQITMTIFHPYGLVMENKDVHVAPWETFEPYAFAHCDKSLNGGPDRSRSGIFVKDLPGDEHGRQNLIYVCRGKMTFDLDNVFGIDEMVDHSVWFFQTDAAGTPTRLINRFAESARNKILDSYRFRAQQAETTRLKVTMPFAGMDFTECLIAIPYCVNKPLLRVGEGMASPVHTDSLPVFPDTFLHLWKPVFEATEVNVAADNTASVGFQLKWNRDGTDVKRKVKLQVESNAGYLPKKFVETDENGQGVIRFRALDLATGDVAKVKLNAGHFSNIASVSFHVV